MDSNTTDRWLSMKEAMLYLGTSRESLQRFAKSGDLPHGRAGATYKFKQADLDAWVLASAVERREARAAKAAK